VKSLGKSLEFRSIMSVLMKDSHGLCRRRDAVFDVSDEALPGSAECFGQVRRSERVVIIIAELKLSGAVLYTAICRPDASGRTHGLVAVAPAPDDDMAAWDKNGRSRTKPALCETGGKQLRRGFLSRPTVPSDLAIVCNDPALQR
jgi:hypothetical protein